MDTLSYKTIALNKQTANKEWLVIDASGLALGRLASNLAKMLRGKHKPGFTPHADCGDNIIVLNAAKVTLSGKKMTAKQYIRHTGYPGGQRFTTPREVLEKHPIRLVEMAVRGMLPKNRLGKQVFKNLYVYEGAEHPHEAQKPKEIEL